MCELIAFFNFIPHSHSAGWNDSQLLKQTFVHRLTDRVNNQISMNARRTTVIAAQMLLVQTLLEATLASVCLDTLEMESSVQVKIQCYLLMRDWWQKQRHDSAISKRRRGVYFNYKGCSKWSKIRCQSRTTLEHWISYRERICARRLWKSFFIYHLIWYLGRNK